MSASWTIVYEDEVSGKILRPGTTFKIFNQRGATFSYTRTVTNQEGAQWIDCFGGGTRVGSRSIRREVIDPKTIVQRDAPPESLEEVSKKAPPKKPSPKKAPPKKAPPKKAPPKKAAPKKRKPPAKKRSAGSKPAAR